jgi:hypothetical protein
VKTKNPLFFFFLSVSQNEWLFKCTWFHLWIKSPPPPPTNQTERRWTKSKYWLVMERGKYIVSIHIFVFFLRGSIFSDKHIASGGGGAPVASSRSRGRGAGGAAPAGTSSWARSAASSRCSPGAGPLQSAEGLQQLN